MEHFHLFSAESNVHVFRREHIGEGRYSQRGVCKGLKEGDIHKSWRDQLLPLTVDKILVQRDAKGRYKNPEDAKMAYYEAELVDPTYGKVKKYTPLSPMTI